MTCIAAIVRGGIVTMGGDSAGVGGLDLTIRRDPKVFRNGEFIIGFTSSFRMGQLLRFAFKPPALTENQDPYEYMCTTWIDGVRACLATGGYKETDKGRETGGFFLVGFRGQLFYVDSDFHVGIAASGFDAVGCGDNIAKGALFILSQNESSNGTEIIRRALEAAEAHSAGVRGPFVILSGGEH